MKSTFALSNKTGFKFNVISSVGKKQNKQTTLSPLVTQNKNVKVLVVC